jgi:hypothetical protein
VNFVPWDRVAYPDGYHTQLNAQARAEARATMARALDALVKAGAGCDETLAYLAERTADSGR